jgi:hypothetical protein
VRQWNGPVAGPGSAWIVQEGWLLASFNKNDQYRVHHPKRGSQRRTIPMSWPARRWKRDQLRQSALAFDATHLSARYNPPDEAAAPTGQVFTGTSLRSQHCCPG